MASETRLTIEVPTLEKEQAEEELAKFSPPLSLSSAVRSAPWASLIKDLREGRFSVTYQRAEEQALPLLTTPMTFYVSEDDKAYVVTELAKVDAPVSMKAALTPYWSRFVESLRSGTFEVTVTIPQEEESA